MFATPEEQKRCRVRVHNGMLVTEGHGMTAVLAVSARGAKASKPGRIVSCDHRCILTEEAGEKTLDHIRDLWNAHAEQQEGGPR